MIQSEEIIQKITHRLVEEFSPEKIILFGSYAWGKPSPDSDLDLLVLLKSSNERGIERMRRARRALRSFMIPKDILVKTTEEFNRYASVYSSLESKILEKGKVLYG